MDKDRATGKVKDIKGRIKRQAGEWTGDTDLQAEGTKDQVEGKAENTMGKIKDEGRKIIDEGKRDLQDIERNRHSERERDKDHPSTGRKAA